ncbi:unnamed protein product [Trichogramma brassicae]|uniref:Protein SEC13 homolog n=1 Tax=Trichogramma brassicae TaxID=86971 RepID=A0A6H5J2X8_9HYME|nr:unnamed protein product [Trichogramma brassicae]
MVSVINTIDTGHEDMIHDAEMDFYGLRLATCSSDNSVKIFDLKNGSQTLVADLKGHVGPVWQVAWAHPKFGNIVASCGYDSSDGSISILTNNGNNWDTHKISNAHTIGCNSVSWCPDVESSFDSVLNQKNNIKRLASAGCDNTIKIWKQEADQWIEETKLEAHSDWVKISFELMCNNKNFSLNPLILSKILPCSWSLTGGILAVSDGNNKVSLWKENSEGQWMCISELNKGQGSINNPDQRIM